MEILQNCHCVTALGNSNAKNRSSPPEVFYNKFTAEHLCRSVISIKLLCSFIENTLRHGCSTVNLTHIFRAPFFKNTSEGLLLQKPRPMEILHGFFLITAGNFTSFLIDPWNFYMLFFNTSGNSIHWNFLWRPQFSLKKLMTRTLKANRKEVSITKTISPKKRIYRETKQRKRKRKSNVMRPFMVKSRISK